MAAGDIQYLLFCEGTLLRDVGSGRLVAAADLRKVTAEAQQALGAAIDSEDSTAIAMAAVRFQHTVQRVTVSPEVSYQVDEDLLASVRDAYTGRYRIGLVVSDKTAARTALKQASAEAAIDALMMPDEFEQHRIYFSDYAVIVTHQAKARLMMPGVDYVHTYRSADELTAYLQNPTLSLSHGYGEDDPTDPLYAYVTVGIVLVVVVLVWILYLGLRSWFG